MCRDTWCAIMMCVLAGGLVPQPAGGASLNGDTTLFTGRLFPVPIVVVRGAVAATTLALVLLTALKVGGS